MILSFFVFLIVSCSMLFGLTSFIVGFRGQLPQESFNQNKTSWNFDTSKLRTSDEDEQVNPSPDRYVLKDDSLLKEAWDDALRESKITRYEGKPDLSWKALKSLIDDHNGNLFWFCHDKENPSKNDPLRNDKWSWEESKRLQEYIFNKTGTFSFNGYFAINYLSENYFSKQATGNNSEVVLNVIPGLGWNSRVSNHRTNIHVVPYGLSQSYLKRAKSHGIYETKKYYNDKNILYSNVETKKRFNYKVGQKVTINDGKIPPETFTYGGIFIPDETKIYFDTDNTDNYYIMNYDYHDYIGNNSVDNEGITQTLSFYITDLWEGVYYPSFIGNAKFDNFIVNNVLSKTFKRWPGIEKIQRYKTYYLFYSAFLLLNIMMIIILVVLNIVLAWFLIKEIINSMASQILFLRSLGLKNSETSLVNTTSIGILLVAAIGISLAGMLGIQYAFVNMIGSFMDVLIKPTYIQPMSLILVFGLMVFLFISYFVASSLLLHKMDLGRSTVVRKSELWFPKTRDLLFRMNINGGISFSFNVKNFTKMIVAFILVTLITAITFVSAEFMTSISQSTKKQVAFNNGIKTFSYSNAIEYSFDSTGEMTGNIKYRYENLSDVKEASLEQVVSPGDWDYITRKTIDKEINDPASKAMLKLHPNIIENWKNAEATYDSQMKLISNNPDTNFVITNKEYFLDGAKPATHYYFQFPSQYSELRVLKNDDKRIKTLFGNSTKPYLLTGKLPVVVSYDFADANHVKVGDDLGKSSLDLGAGVWLNFIQPYVAGITTMNNTDGFTWIRQSDFNDYLIDREYSSDLANDNQSKEIKKIRETIKNIVSDKHGYHFNAFEDTKDIPTPFHQILSTSKGLPDFNKLIDSLNSVSVKFIAKEADKVKTTIDPLSNTLLVILLLAIVLMLTFIIFMVTTIMFENDDIIFIMKALGYSKGYILRRIITGYLLAIVIGFVIGLVISWACLGVLDSAFMPVIFAHIAFYWTWPIIVLLIAFVVVLSGITLAISMTKIEQRSLTSREE